MKKTIKAILGSITAIAFVLVMSLSVLTFQNINGNASTDIPNVNVQGSGGSSNVNDGSNTEKPSNPDPKPEVGISKFEGIYEYYYIPTFLDIYYDDYDKLINYFNTKDLNGVYNAIKPLGYDDFVKSVKENDEYFALYVCNNEIKTLSYDSNGKFTFKDDIEPFTFEINDGKITTSLGDSLKIEFDEKTNTPTVYVQFHYINENNEIINTPLYIKYALKAVENSVNAISGKEYKYAIKTGSIVSDSTDPFDMESKLETLANLLGIQVDEGTTISEALENGLSKNTYLFSEDGSRITIKEENNFSISKANENNEFVWKNATAKIVLHELNLSTGIDTIAFSIDIDENTQFMFIMSNNII